MVSTTLSKQIEESCKAGNFARAWRLARALSERHIGPRKRRLRILRTARPLRQQCIDFHSLPGQQGGMHATEVDIDNIKKDRNLDPPFFFPITNKLKKLAKSDCRGIMWSFQLASKRKAVPSGSLPLEGWWLCSYPGRVSNHRLAPREKRGVGFVPATPAEAPLFRCYIYTLCIGIRRRRRIPMDWNVSQACSITKLGQQSNPNRCKRERLVHLLDPVGKGFLGHLVKKRQLSSPAPWYSDATHGYLKHRSREGAIGCVRMLKYRLSSAHISHMLRLLDLSNAFASVDHAHMDETLSHFVLEEDRDLAILRYRDTYFVIECPDGTVQMQSRCGGLQGDTFMVYAWLSAFAPLIAQFQTDQIEYDPLSRLCLCRAPDDKLTDSSLTIYADDLAKVFCLQPPKRAVLCIIRTCRIVYQK